MKTQFLACLAVFSLVAPAQTPKPTAKPAAAASKGAPASGVDTIIELVKGGMSESLVLKTIQKSGKAYNLTPAEMLKLQKAGVSENVINVMMDPTAATAAPTPVASVAPVRAEAAVTPVSLPTVTKAPKKRKIAVMPFDYSAVTTWVTYWFHSNVNIGQGIRAMLTARMAQAKNITLLERARLDAIEKELNLNNTGLVNQGTKVKMGKVSGADCILLGDITIFGRDDKSEHSRVSGQTYGHILRRVPMVGSRAGSLGQFSKEEKAVVAIALRIVDTETGEVLETAEARGESSRSSKNWDVFVSGGNSGSYSNDMTASNFQETIIGEATSDAVNKVVKFLDEKVPQIPLRTRKVEGRVAKITGNTIILGIGASEGVENGDRFEILQIMSEVLDPTTKEVLDVDAVKVGEMVVTNARDKISTGPYSGRPLVENYQKGYTARLLVQ